MPRRRAPLVCQFVENLSSEALQVYADVIRAVVGRRHGVYALYRRDKLYYVGLASNLRNRLGHHLKDRHRDRWDRFSVYLTIDDKHLRELESLVIKIAQPKGNKQSGKFARAENLTRTLEKRLRVQHKEEIARIMGRSSDGRARRPHRKKIARADRALADKFGGTITLRATFKGKKHTARLRTNGTIRVGRRVFDSPSSAAESIVDRPVNGWSFWRYEQAPGLWAYLEELRAR